MSSALGFRVIGLRMDTLTKLTASRLSSTQLAEQRRHFHHEVRAWLQGGHQLWIRRDDTSNVLYCLSDAQLTAPALLALLLPFVQAFCPPRPPYARCPGDHTTGTSPYIST